MWICLFLLHIASLKNYLSVAQVESFPFGLWATFAAVFVLIYCLREFLCLQLLNAIKAAAAIVLQDLPLMTTSYSNVPLLIRAVQFPMMFLSMLRN